jgi:hypothetical protein
MHESSPLFVVVDMNGGGWQPAHVRQLETFNAYDIRSNLLLDLTLYDIHNSS